MAGTRLLVEVFIRRSWVFTGRVQIIVQSPLSIIGRLQFIVKGPFVLSKKIVALGRKDKFFCQWAGRGQNMAGSGRHQFGPIADIVGAKASCS